jgi:hypothetical protein
MYFDGDKQMEVFYLGCVPLHVRLFEVLDILTTNLKHFETRFAAMYGPSRKQEIFFGTIRKVLLITRVMHYLRLLGIAAIA